MHDIRFIKTLSYDTRGDGSFTYICRLLRGEMDPGSKSPGKLQLPDKAKVFYSPERRVKECISRQRNGSDTELNELSEIIFDPSLFISEGIWKEQGSSAVRRAFIEAFEQDKLFLKRDKIFEQIEKLLDMCRKESEGQEVICVSHSFRMKLVEAYIKTGGAIKKSPSLVREFIDPNNKTYEFGGGFTLK